MDTTSPSYLLLGQLRRQYLITPEGKALLDQPGGNLLYAACGLNLWGEEPGIVARVGEDYPRNWLDDFQKKGMNTSGVNILPEAHDLRSFYAYEGLRVRHTDDPVKHFARREISFPKALLGYKDHTQDVDSRKALTSLSLRKADLPENYQYATSAHICPVDFLTHTLMPATLRQMGATTITLDPGAGYMNPSFRDQIPSLLPGLTAFLPSEEELRSMFHGQTDDLWEMAEALATFGCKIIVIKRGLEGQYLFDIESNTKYVIPAYPSRIVDPTGAGDAFCGGFLIGLRKTYDPLRAVLYGNISASLVIEGTGPFYASDSLPGLHEARLNTLLEAVHKA